MAGTRISFDATFDDSTAQARLSELIGRMEDRSGFMANVGEHLLNATRDRFRDQVSPEGTPWERLKPATIRDRERRKFTPIQILTRHTRSGLRASLNSQVTKDEVRIGTPKVYAAIHQFGGTIERPAGEGVVFRHVNWKSQKMTRGFAPKKGRKGQPKANFVQKVQRKA